MRSIKKVFFYVINRLFIKNKKKIVLFSSPNFSDNPRSIYREIIKQKINYKYKIIWLVDKDNNIKFTQYNVIKVKKDSIKGLYHYFTSKYIFHNIGLYGNTQPTKNQLVYAIGHGMPMKKDGLMSNKKMKNMKGFKCSYLISTSDFFHKYLSNAFGVNVNKIITLGYPRNDDLFKKNIPILKVISNYSDFDRKIIWMPTYRKSKIRNENSDGVEFEFGVPFINYKNLDDFNKFLKKDNILLVLKLHPLQAINKINFNYSNIKIIFNENIFSQDLTVYDFLSCFDALITDFSSVYYDFLLLDKPIAFALQDFKEYTETRGIIYEEKFENFFPGKICYNFDQVKSFISSINKNKDDLILKRKKLKILFQKYHDQKSSYRILKHAKIIKEV